MVEQALRLSSRVNHIKTRPIYIRASQNVVGRVYDEYRMWKAFVQNVNNLHREIEINFLREYLHISVSIS